MSDINFLEEMANFVFASKYARYNDELKRRETWEEAVYRLREMHLQKFSFLPTDKLDKINWAMDQIVEKRIVPSMRSLQFGGQAILAHNARIYNCGATHVDSIRIFAESFYLLLCGVGVTFGLSEKYMGRLPDLVGPEDKNGTLINYVVQDTIEGWSESVEALLSCYLKNTPFTGRKIVFDYSKIRKKGSKLKIGGGKAPGYKGLKNCHKQIKSLLDHVIEDLGQKRLKTINAYDILMHCADAVLSGGIRRAATAVVFQKDDDDMMTAKTFFSVEKYKRFSFDPETNLHYGKVLVKNKWYDVEIYDYDYQELVAKNRISWFYIEPQRARSNNSVLLLTNETTKEEFKDIISKTKEFGEPGFVFASESMDTLFNPCVTADTVLNVMLQDGSKTEITMGDLVLRMEKGEIFHILSKNVDSGKDSYELVSAGAMTRKNATIILIELENGKSIKCTPDHKIFTKNRGYVEASKLTEEDDIVCV